MADNYSVIYTGVLQPGVDPKQVVEAFAVRFGIHPQKVRDMIGAGTDVAIGSGLDAGQARELHATLERMGLTVRIEPPIDDEPVDEPGPAPTPTTRETPTRQTSDTGPGASGDLHDPRRVSAAHGWYWLKQGFSMVFAAPIHWIGALLIWTVINIVMNLVPILNIVSALVTAVFMGGVMLGAHEQHNGGSFRIERLFSGFSRNFGALFLVGVLYMLGFIIIALVIAISVGGLLSMAPDLHSPEAELPPEVMMHPMTWLPLLSVFLLVVPLLMAYWFAPALVMIDNISPPKAMGMSFRACLKNVLPFLVYGVISMLLFLLGAIPLMLGLLIVIPGVVASVYAAYRDIFHPAA